MKHLPIYILFVVCATLIAVNRLTPFYISDYRLHFVVLFIAASTFVIIIGHLFHKLKTTKSMILVVLIVGCLCFLRGYFSWGGDWKTQTVLYRSIEDSDKTIDIQLRGDRFAFGYRKRVVEIQKLVPGMLWTTDIDTLTLSTQEWRRVNEQVNSISNFK
ncbi:MAG TPA: hypothetical protein VF581_08245 [Flavobacterium sp.]|jgi:hypothetical protein